jgi:DNA-binding transcriptional MocR family regulator
VEAIRTAAEAAQFDQLGYSESGGEPRLRAVLADHLNRRRGAAAQSSTISIFSGAGQSMSQLARALFEAGHTHLGIEDPGSTRLGPAARTAGLELVALPVDDDDRHLHTSRLRFRARRAALLAALERRIPECRISGAETGLHLLLELPAGSDAHAILAEAPRRDMRLCDMDELRFESAPAENRLMLGYGNLNDSVVDEAVAVLAEVIRQAGTDFSQRRATR